MALVEAPSVQLASLSIDALLCCVIGCASAYVFGDVLYSSESPRIGVPVKISISIAVGWPFIRGTSRRQEYASSLNYREDTTL
jgi:hypothetical protein